MIKQKMKWLVKSARNCEAGAKIYICNSFNHVCLFIFSNFPTAAQSQPKTHLSMVMMQMFENRSQTYNFVFYISQALWQHGIVNRSQTGTFFNDGWICIFSTMSPRAMTHPINVLLIVLLTTLKVYQLSLQNHWWFLCFPWNLFLTIEIWIIKIMSFIRML